MPDGREWLPAGGVGAGFLVSGGLAGHPVFSIPTQGRSDRTTASKRLQEGEGAVTTRNELTRRTVLAGGLAAGITPLFARSAAASVEDYCKVSLTPIKTRPERAVSLRRVSEALAAGKPARFEGLTRLDGYVVDDENKDIVLFGISESGQPELQPADFIVALRSAYVRGEVYRKSAAISIDSEPGYYRRVDGLKITNPADRRRYQELCALADLRKVRVDGMPRHCRVAKILLDADIKMKQVAQGRAKLPIRSPFLGDFDSEIKDWRAEIAAGRDPSAISGAITRYWFTPGRFGYGAPADNPNIVRFTHAQVTLRTEEEADTDSGRKSTGKINSYARAFTCAWTERMEEVYRSEPLWQEMRNMYRHFAMARIMRDLDAIEAAGFDAAFLLDGYEIPRVPVPDTTAGGSRVETATRRDGRMTYTYARSTCGGVDVGFNKPLEKRPDADGDIHLAGRNVLGSRPAPVALAWAITPGALKDIGKPSTPVSRPPAAPPGEPDRSRSLEDMFKKPAPGAAPGPAPSPSAPADKPRSLQELFKT